MRSIVLTAILVCMAIDVTLSTAQPVSAPQPVRLIVFAEPGFPAVDAGPPAPIPGAIEATSTSALADALGSRGVLVWRHGSAFPAEAWGSIARFLEHGGSLLYLGGEPFTRPVVGKAGGRLVQPRTVSLLKVLHLNQAYRESAAGASVTPARGRSNPSASRRVGNGAFVTVLEPRLSDTKDFADEDGSPGARDAIVHPLMHLSRQGDDPRFPFAAAAFAIDRLRGSWAGGRWVFWLVSEAPSDAERDALIAEAKRPALDFRVDPTFGTFHEGEQPSVVVRVHRPLAADRITWPVRITVSGPSGAGPAVDASLQGTDHASVRVPLPGTWKPGLYRVTADVAGIATARTGFWIFDPVLFASGDALTFDGYTMRRNGRPEPVVGTTMMSATVHRDFLFEPDAATWDETFAELASLKINIVRTGVWSGWKKISLDANTVDEGFLRGLEGYYLTARSHGIPVIFNLFAFLPEMFGGENPFMDPRAIEGQRGYISAVASRFAGAKEMLWDFINEPSFSSPRKLWRTRPNGDSHERAAFAAWLERRYAAHARAGETWQDVVRARWRLLPTEGIDLPSDDDFDDRHLMGATRPYRATDYMLFAQDVFNDWTRQMTDAVRRAGSEGPVSVGQDEGGLTTRPSPLFHHPLVAFTSMHTWWNNDALLWDGILAKATGKPLLVSETGIMQRELLSGEAVRDSDRFARLLSRKIGYAFAAGAFGVIQWCYDVNPFMASDNEVAIGLRRVDGSYKPEHRILREVAAFVSTHREEFDGYVEPEVALVVPSSDMFSSRDTATGATRAGVRALFERLAIPVRAVSEYNAASEIGRAKAIVLPATRGISSAGWAALTEATRQGAHLVSDGWFETDDAGLPAERLGLARRPLAAVEETSPAADQPRVAVRFGGTLPDSWYAAAGDGPTVKPLGRGSVHHHPLPLEWADDVAATAAHYRTALAAAGIEPVGVVDGGVPEGCIVRVLPFRQSFLVVGINESSKPRALTVRLGARSIELDVPAGMSQMDFVRR